jgi:hypothetical protein
MQWGNPSAVRQKVLKGAGDAVVLVDFGEGDPAESDWGIGYLQRIIGEPDFIGVHVPFDVGEDVPGGGETLQACDG